MPTGSELTISDLWWVDLGGEELLLFVGHHMPITDDDNPFAKPWFRSIRENRLSETKVEYSSEFLQTWKARCKNVNVYRSLQIFMSSGDDATSLLGPFLIDIDNSDWEDSIGGYHENLQDALDVVRRAVRVLTTKWSVKGDDFRVFFSGRKGFNVEIRPSAVGINGSCRQQLVKSWEMQNDIRSVLKAQGNFEGATVGKHGTVIDPIYGGWRSGAELNHPYTRLHGSINRWIGTTGETSRRRIEIQIPELFTQDIQTMIENSKV